ncbi:MAG TPA: phosphatidylglycerophosphatase A [Phycisphaerae bacterium]|jgi:phosphatidylglycerophosphatase A|nr:phosphatidylglycerophosphatase A [Phycisphaerae bacterium]HOB75334.1 phosphatidylglycerophosphatase A [Phycisphaerae bacterium]HOJ53230.1 phosphatidylglycerophosphatase A [Phycisphaerae bacterium]HOL25194.1 phosphatidylglycerophosphatase A [Phycisphaerae bacterium]HPP20252.1 phosphatidylglycerophosphatase A [Phycisphaerae bacterium]
MKIGHWLITGLGLGYAPVASGTFGSAGAIAIAWMAWTGLHLAGYGPYAVHLPLAVLTLLATWGCVHWGPWAVEFFGKRARKPTDPGHVVLDEFAGQWLALLGLAMPDWKSALLVLAVQFFLFRVFDVIKPPPANRLERLPFGWGILLDDLAAGVYANLVGQVLFRFVL